EPLVGIEEIIAGAETATGRAEIVGGGDLDESLRPGETLKRDIRQSPHSAAPAVAPDNVAAAQPLRLTLPSNGHLDMIGALFQRRYGRRQADLANTAPLDMRDCSPHQFVLLPLQRKRIRDFAGKEANIECRDKLTGQPVAKMKQRRAHPAARIFRKGF